MTTPLTLDVRAELRSGSEPPRRILQTVGQLQHNQPLRLLTTFEPIPLYALLGRKGFGHTATRHAEGDWEVLFVRRETAANDSVTRQCQAADHAISAAEWSSPKASLDNRGLQPPEPLIRILDTLEHLAPGEVLEAINEREPLFLYPELETRGATIRVEKRADEAFRLLIRRGG